MVTTMMMAIILRVCDDGDGDMRVCDDSDGSGDGDGNDYEKDGER